MNSGNFSRKLSTVRNLGGFLASPSDVKVHRMLHKICGSSMTSLLCVISTVSIRSNFGQQLVANIKTSLPLSREEEESVLLK